ncbi:MULTISPECIES: hypothetical protein [Comamonas]|uniref:Uncharacterized protein n=1 Tax=Comamonas thiooxydans TaxID=363952 RepID=A0A0E3BW90_9BURK|nr:MULTISPECIES: hypothetical protein [Comamonas]KGG91635.1 hypothetical protein P245_13610 [Comamonas thiooxydans]KGH12894.1 hypothetical protein P608_09650 [Comamonas thiooxydans]KGH23995.1 hypothetical protein P606_09865 [Comamonas thiooxydans]KGH25623.1 hypothetical protein P607_05240 [Comamonas thiooxydans]MDH1254385.1 hypothetical protein [Comamonas thiooxydans]
MLDKLEQKHVLENTLIDALSTALARHVDEDAEDATVTFTAAGPRLSGAA